MRKPKPRRGRPPLGNKARSAAYLLKLVPEERSRWQAAAESRGVSLAELVRGAVERDLAR